MNLNSAFFGGIHAQWCLFLNVDLERQCYFLRQCFRAFLGSQPNEGKVQRFPSGPCPHTGMVLITVCISDYFLRIHFLKI